MIAGRPKGYKFSRIFKQCQTGKQNNVHWSHIFQYMYSKPYVLYTCIHGRLTDRQVVRRMSCLRAPAVACRNGSPGRWPRQGRETLQPYRLENVWSASGYLQNYQPIVRKFQKHKHYSHKKPHAKDISNVTWKCRVGGYPLNLYFMVDQRVFL